VRFDGVPLACATAVGMVGPKARSAAADITNRRKSRCFYWPACSPDARWRRPPQRSASPGRRRKPTLSTSSRRQGVTRRAGMDWDLPDGIENVIRSVSLGSCGRARDRRHCVGDQARPPWPLDQGIARPPIDRNSKASAISGPASPFGSTLGLRTTSGSTSIFWESIYGSAPFGSPSVADPHVLPAMFWVARLTRTKGIWAVSSLEVQSRGYIRGGGCDQNSSR
jgi:hypothetical protein